MGTNLDNKKSRLRFYFPGIALFMLLAFWAEPAAALGRRFVEPGEGKTEIKNPQARQVFYGELDGQPDIFEFTAAADFSLYVGLLVPALQGIGRDVSAAVTRVGVDGSRIIADLKADEAGWTEYEEQSTGDRYFRGPEFNGGATGGIYRITVLSPDNQGKYVLFVGEKEEFSAKEIKNTLSHLPRLKVDFFGKSRAAVFEGSIGHALLAAISVMIIFFGTAAAMIIAGRKKRSTPGAQ